MEEIDPLRVLGALGVAPPERVTPIAGGWDTLVWRVDAADTRPSALRVFRPDQSQTCRREVLAMEALAEHRLPVPSVTAHTVTGDRPAMLMSWCPGQPLLQRVAAEPWRAWTLGVAMGRMHARLHRVQVSDLLTRELPGIEIGDGPHHILHMDFHPLNIMTDGRRVTGVLDWANVAVGDARADLARTVTLLRLAPMPPGSQTLLVRVLRIVLELAWRNGYERDGLSRFRGMNPFYVWAGEWMERDLRRKLGKPGVWLEPSDLTRISEWTRRQRGGRAERSPNEIC
ncbi:MAG: phosphotransferase [Chloroflexi bacterium]|nr:phosphotransferase [Chloroflexota bacterium]